MARRSQVSPFFGWVSTELAPLYPSTLSLKTMVHCRDDGLRPLIELEATDHPLALEQHQGVPISRVAQIYSHFEHGAGGSNPGRV